MKLQYDFRIKEEIEEPDRFCDEGTEEELQQLLKIKEEVDSKTQFVFSNAEKRRFYEMMPVIREFAFVQSAVLEIDLRTDKGRFICLIEDMFFCQFYDLDKEVLNYMKKHTSYISVEDGKIKLEITVSFTKRRVKLWRTRKGRERTKE